MTHTDRRSFLVQTGGLLAAAALVPSSAAAHVFRAGAAVGIGVIGTGRQGRNILSELGKLEAARIVAVCDTDDLRLRGGQRRASDSKAYSSASDLIADPGVEAVFIATPTHRHRAMVEEAVAAGKHVYCEAPIAHTVEDSRAIARAAAGSSKVVQFGYEGRANPVYSLARSFAVSGTLRELVSLHAQHHEKSSWRSPANDAARDKELNWKLDPEVSLGLEGETGAVQLDVHEWFINKSPVRVSGHGSIRLHNDGRKMPDTVHLRLEYADGLVATYESSLANSYGGRYEVLHGADATMKLAWSHGWMFKEADAPTQGWEVYANRQQFHNDEGITLIADATKLASQGKLKEGVGLPYSSTYYAVEAFLKSVLEGAKVVTDPGDAHRSTVVGIAAHEAVSTGKAIDITDAMMAL